MDWSLCALCQRDGQNIVVPSANLNPDVCGYSRLAKNIDAFTNEGLSLPSKITVTLRDLKGETNVADNLKENKAQWHKGCQAELAPSKLKRALESAANKKRKVGELPFNAPSKRTRSSLDAKTHLQSCLCLFCNEPGVFTTEYKKLKHPPAWQKRMCKVRILITAMTVRKAATEMGDSLLLTKLSEGSLFARGACYHHQCLTEFRNRYRTFLASENPDTARLKDIESSVLAQTMMYIEESLAKSTDTDVATSIKLSDVRKFYDHSLARMTGKESNVNVTRLKDKILELESDLQAVSDKKEIYISYKDDLAAALKYASRSEVNDVVSLCRIVRKIKAELADRKQIFNGHFEENCQEQSVSPTFLSLMNMLTEFEITDDVESSKLSPALVLAQLLAFNSAKNRKSTGAIRHNADQETPVAIYIAFLIHSKTRSEDLVNRLHSLGLCISYDRLSTLSTYLGNSVLDQCDKDGLVCPSSLRRNLFTTQAVDNIDHNPSSRTAKDSWHGTAISTSQHLKDKDDGTIWQPLDLQKDKLQSKLLKQLPTEYTSISPYVLKNKNIVTPTKAGTSQEVSIELSFVIYRRYEFAIANGNNDIKKINVIGCNIPVCTIPMNN